MKISYSIVTYNNEKIIADTVKSLSDTVPAGYDYTLYIIDNNSTDDTVSIVKEIGDEHVIVIELTDNKGFGHGHNAVLPVLTSDYHFVVNPDITVESEGEIFKMIDYLEHHKEVGMIVPLITNKDGSIQHLNKKHPTVLDMFIRRISPNLFKSRQDRYVCMEKGYDTVYRVDYASGCFMVFRTSLFKQLNGFDEQFFMYLEDADITRRVNQISVANFFPDAKIIHEWERAGHKRIKYAWITVKSMRVYFKKWGWKIL